MSVEQTRVANSAIPEWTQKQEAILTTAARVFAERGYATTDVQIIADQVGVGKGTVYRNFSTKDDLFCQAVDREIRLMTICIEDAFRSETDALEGLHSVIRAYLKYFDENPQLVELIILERAMFRDRKESTYIQYREQVRPYWEGIVNGLIADGVLRPLPAQDVFAHISDTLYGAMFTRHFMKDKGSYESRARTLVNILFNGLLTDGQRILIEL
jgi:AcrR family transcriptional regulator